MKGPVDAVVVGAGPNGLAAALVLAAAGVPVRVYEAAATPGGGCRTAELTLPGYRHDVCSAVHPLALASPFFHWFDLGSWGVRLLQPEIAFAHPLEGGRAAAVSRSLGTTAASLGTDGPAYVRLMAPLAAHCDDIVRTVLSPVRPLPAPAFPALRFGRLGVRSAATLAKRFNGPLAPAMVAGVAAHAMRPLDSSATAGVALLFGLLAHNVGWPVAEGGSEAIVGAMVKALESQGVEVVTGHRVQRLEELPPARAVLLDVSPRELVFLAGEALSPSYREKLRRFRYGPGVCKVDWALSGPVPWAAEECRAAGTVHVGGEFSEVARSEWEVSRGRHPERPFVLCAQPGVVDCSRAPAGGHTLWTYCHVPSGSHRDMSEAMASQLERFAPGFRDLVLARSVMTAADVEAHDANYVGGDIAGGVQDLWQTVFRPVRQWAPYRTPLKGVYLCSSSTPPGPGVHGRCGELAALRALREVFGTRHRPSAPAVVPLATARTA